MTRRFEKGLENLEEGNFSFNKNKGEVKLYGEKGSVIEVIKSRYKIGEVVAVKQSYKEIASYPYFISQCAANEQSVNDMMLEKGWNNKMFVAAYYMPHHIRITDIRCERLQEISDKDFMKEGIRCCGNPSESSSDFPLFGFNDFEKKVFCNYATPRKAFASLIDKVSGKGTWDRNPWVFAYSFERID